MAVLVYIHGFLSSPQSAKAVMTAEFIAGQGLAIDCHIPQLPNYPARTLHQLEDFLAPLLASDQRVGLVGSSLGGFFATVLAERYDLPAVLINPAVRPWRPIHDALGENQNPYTGEHFTITEQHLLELQDMAVDVPAASSRFWVLLQEGDEVLDYRDAVDYYRDFRMTVEPGGSHHFDGFERYLPDVIKFLDLHPEG